MEKTDHTDSLHVDRFTVRNAIDTLAQEHPLIKDLFGANPPPIRETRGRPQLHAMADVMHKVEAATGIRFNDEILFVPQLDAVVLNIPMRICSNGSVMISEAYLKQIAKEPQLFEAVLMHEASHFYHADSAMMEHLAPIWSNFIKVTSTTGLYDASPEEFTAAVKATYGSIEAFIRETQAISGALMDAVRTFPQFGELGKLPPLELLKRLTIDPQLLAHLKELPTSDKAFKDRSHKFNQIMFLTPGYLDMELDYLGKRGVPEEDTQQALTIIGNHALKDAGNPDLHAVRQDEVEAVGRALTPLRAYKQASEDFAAFIESYMQATEHRADIFSAYHIGSAETYNTMLEQLHGTSGEAKPLAFTNGVQMHPTMSERKQAVSEAVGTAPSSFIHGSTAEHHGAKPMTRLMTLLSQQWQNTPAGSARG